MAGLIFAALAIYATYDVFNRSKPRKQLQIIVEATIPLVDINPEASDDITILYKNQPVDNVILLQIRLENTGNQPIVPDDYIEPVTFSFGPGSEIADLSITDMNPTNIGLVISKTSQYQAELAPVLLNPGDVAMVRFALLAEKIDSVIEDFQIDGRIVGVREVELALPAENTTNNLIGAIVGLIVGAILTIVLNRLSIWLFTMLQSNKTSS